MLLERLSDATNVPSIGNDPAQLAVFKQYAGCPPDPDWTEKDDLLKGLLLAAERWIDDNTGSTYRPRRFKLSFTPEDLAKSKDFRVPRRMIDTASVAFHWASDSVLFTDYFFSDLTVCPKLHLNPDRCTFETNDRLPLIGTFTTLASNDETHLTIIRMLAAHYYQNPSAVGVKQVSFGPAFDALLTSLRTSFL